MLCSNPLVLQKGGSAVVKVPCGRCMPCRVNKQNEWTIRIMHEKKYWDSKGFPSYFVTLTFNDENCPKNGSISKSDVQEFVKKLRKKKFKFSYFACGEYGENYLRPHYHILIFGVNLMDGPCNGKMFNWADHPSFRKDIDKCWQKGFTYVGSLTESSARYCAKYVQKQLYGTLSGLYTELGIEREFMLSSRRPALGKTVGKNFVAGWAQKGYLILSGKKHMIPRYYLNWLSDREKIEYKLLRQNAVSARIKKKEMEEGLSVYDQIDKEVRERDQREKNILAKVELKKNKIERKSNAVI